MTTLPLPPGTLAVLLLLGLGAALFIALALTRPRRPDRPAAIPPEARPALLLLAGLTWAVLFLMTLAAAFSGVADAVADPSTAGLGLGACWSPCWARRS